MGKFSPVKTLIRYAEGISFDGCHKIYLLMNEKAVSTMREYGYEQLITADEMGYLEMLETVKDWYRSSCGLRFVEAFTAGTEDVNEMFDHLIPQGF